MKDPYDIIASTPATLVVLLARLDDVDTYLGEQIARLTRPHDDPDTRSESDGT
jgi:hypothetical protein